MATETDGPPQADRASGADTKTGEAQIKKPAKEQTPKGGPSAKGSEAAAATTGGEKKLSGAELKKKAKEEKAARRAQAKSAQVSQPSGSADQQAGSGDGKSGKGKGKEGGQQGQQSQQHHRLPVRPGGATPGPPKEVKPAIPECFSHLSMARRIDMTQADKDVDPAVLILGQHMSTFALSDSITRLEATLQAFKKVIDSYTTPHGNTFSRHFTSHVLNPQIEYLTACRPMCFSMGNAVRWLKLQISKIDIDMPDLEAKKLLCSSIDTFAHERITVADYVIVQKAVDQIEDGHTIFTYASHHLVERAILKAHSHGRQFSVVIADDPYERVGLELSKRLAGAGIPVTYASDLGGLRANLQGCSMALLGAEAMFSNGSIYARAGTCDVAIAAKDLTVEVVALCESINFTERVSTDPLTFNEIDPERNTDRGIRLLFDTTRQLFIDKLVTELGNSEMTSVPSTLRKLEEL